MWMRPIIRSGEIYFSIVYTQKFRRKTNYLDESDYALIDPEIIPNQVEDKAEDEFRIVYVNQFDDRFKNLR